MTEFDVREWTIADLAAAMNRGELTALTLTRSYLSRIFAHNKEGATLRAIESLEPKVLQLANQLDEERATRGPRSPLHGIPIVLKANIDTADGLPTTAGSVALATHYAKSDAFIVEKLRQAGAIIIGKAAMTEWANFMTTDMPPGYSSLNGQVLNPYNLAADPGGSSSGCAVAVAANFCAGAIGTETSRSIAHPCAQNGIVGIRPTMGLVSRRGLLPLSVTRDIAGPMARTVFDAALLLNVIANPDEQDPVTTIPWQAMTRDFTANLNENTAFNLRELRLGIPRKGFVDKLSQAQLALFMDAVKTLRGLGITIVDHTEIETIDQVQDTDVLRYEFKGSLNRYLAQAGAPVQSLRVVIAYNKANAEKALKYGQSILERCEAETSGMFTESAYAPALERDRKLAHDEGIQATLDKHHLHALLFPSFHGAALAAKAEVPSVYVPAGHTADGVPFTIAFTGAKFSDDRMIQLAYAYEQATKHRRPAHLGDDNHE
jgi:amidase